jgi:nucleoside-diphosphate-sugar epimerase
MTIVITGGLGFVGTMLARRLLARGGAERLVLFDAHGAAAPPADVADRVAVVRGDIRDRELVRRVLQGADLSVFHLASVVSAQGEQDFDLALTVNLDGCRHVLEACRSRPPRRAEPSAGSRSGSRPRVVFASTLAAFGGSAMPETVTDTTKLTPQTTYGTTKAMCELLVNDYTRKGFVDGRTARLPTVIVRAGAPNPAASAFASAVFREPLAGRDYVLPVGPDTRVPVIGARTVADCLARLGDLDGEALGDDRAVMLPSISVTVGEMVESLRRVAGDRPLGAVEVRPDPEIERIVRTWPPYASSERADALGLPRDRALDDIVREYIADFA